MLEGRKDRACILARNTNEWVQQDFTCTYLVMILMKYIEDGKERQQIVSSAYLPYDSKDPPPSREMENPYDSVRKITYA